MNENRTIHLVDIPIGGKDGFVWNRLHEEREELCETLLQERDDKEPLHARLRKVDDALDRLMSGSYGNCSSCGQSIDDTKLALDPALELCVKCCGPEESSADDLSLESLNAFDTIVLRTHNSLYRILLLEPKIGRVLVEGGEYLREPSEGLIKGSAVPGFRFKGGVISIGSRLEIWVDEKVFLTSPVKAIHVQPNGDAESVADISAALH